MGSRDVSQSICRAALVADDDPVYRETGAHALREAGFTVHEADGGRAAVAALTSEPFDLALLDLGMPDMGGLEVLREQRRAGANMRTPSIVITGHDDSASVSTAFEAGATSFLTKPLNWVLFIPHVEFVLRSARLERELRDAVQATEFLGDLKTSLMNDLAREFQDPLRTMYSFTELMRQEVYGPVGAAPYRGFVLDMSRALGQLNGSLAKMLESGRGLGQSIRLHEEDIDLAAALSRAVGDCRELCMSRGLMLESQIDLPVTRLRADPALFSQLLRNLVEGATRVSPRGGRLRISARRSENGDIEIEVHDQGQPLTDAIVREVNGEAVPAQMPASAELSRELGLKVARILAETHSGALRLGGDAETGNHCRLTLPRSRLRVSRER